MIDYRCSCGTLYELADELIGKPAECHVCGKVGRVQGTISEPAAPSPPAPLPSPSNSLPEAGETIRQAWELYKKRCLVMFLITIVFIVLAVGAVVLFAGAGFAVFAFLPDVKNILLPVCILLAALTMAYIGGWGYAAYSAAAVPPSLGFKECLSHGRTKALAFIALTVWSSFLIVGGYLLFIIPGIIFTVWFFFAGFILVRENVSALEAIMTSREYVRGRWWPVALRLLLVWFICFLISAIPGIGQILSILVIPFGVLHAALLSQSLKTVRGATPARGKSTAIVLTGLSGYIVLPAIIFAVAGTFLMNAAPAIKKVVTDAIATGKISKMRPAGQTGPASSFVSQTSSPDALAASGAAMEAVKADGSGELTDPASPQPMLSYNYKDKPEMDVTRVAFESDGVNLTVTVELKEEFMKYLESYQGGNGVAGIYMDTDLNESTGMKSFYGDKPGFELEVDMKIGLDYGSAGGKVFGGRLNDAKLEKFLPSYAVKGVDEQNRKQFKSKYLDKQALDHSSVLGRQMKVTVPYTLLGVKPGQTVRIATEKEIGSTGGNKYLPDLLLKLK